MAPIIGVGFWVTARLQPISEGVHMTVDIAHRRAGPAFYHRRVGDAAKADANAVRISDHGDGDDGEVAMAFGGFDEGDAGAGRDRVEARRIVP